MWCHFTGSSSVKPFPEPVLTYCLLYPWVGTYFSQIESKYKRFLSSKCKMSAFLFRPSFVKGLETTLYNWCLFSVHGFLQFMSIFFQHLIHDATDLYCCRQVDISTAEGGPIFYITICWCLYVSVILLCYVVICHTEGPFMTLGFWAHNRKLANIWICFELQ